MAGNSTIRLADVVEDASSFGEIAPTLAVGGLGASPAISIANSVMQILINGGPNGEAFNWKWNRFNVTPVGNPYFEGCFFTISFQQDYFVPGLNNLAWLESAWCSQINQTSVPKQNFPLECHKDLMVTYQQTGNVGKICWIPNSMANTGTWGAVPLGPTAAEPGGNPSGAGPNVGGLQNPGPGVIYTNPIGTLQQPINATTCITDPNGNLWALTTFGTCGSTQPSWPTNPTYPVFGQVPQATATTVTDGSCIWTAINPSGQAMRISPIPSQTGVTWLVVAVGQYRAPRFKNLQQLINPVPDDFEWAFKEGFFAECYKRAPDSKVFAKWEKNNEIWMKRLDMAVRQADKELDDFGFYPSSSIMSSDWGTNTTTPAAPYGPLGLMH